MRILLSYICLSLLLFSCSDEEIDQSVSQNVIIGLFFGKCAGDCAEMYLYNGGELFPDIITNGYTEEPIFSNTSIVVSDEIRAILESLGPDTPQLLSDNVGGIFGQPDAGDWGAIYYQRGNDSWTLDNANDNNPDEIQEFVARIQALMTVLE